MERIFKRITFRQVATRKKVLLLKDLSTKRVLGEASDKRPKKDYPRPPTSESAIQNCAVKLRA